MGTLTASVVLQEMIVVLCIGCVGWLVAQQRGLKLRHRIEIAQGRAEIAFFRTLLEKGPQGVVMIGTAREERSYLGQSRRLFEFVLGSPDGPDVIRTIDRLTGEGTGFSRIVATACGPMALSGITIGSRAVLYINRQEAEENISRAPNAVAGDTIERCARLEPDDWRALIEGLPLAVAVLKERRLAWYNRAFSDLWELPAEWRGQERSYGEVLEYLREKRRLPEQRNFAEWKQAQLRYCDGLESGRTEFWHKPDGTSTRIVMEPRPGGGLFLTCQDITEKLRLESSLTLLSQVQKATLDTLDEGIAIFGTDGRLVTSNAPFARLWQLTEHDLAANPHFAELADICNRRIGRDGIWGTVAYGINSAEPDKFGEWSKAKRADGRVLSLAMSRLPNGSTVVTFSDLTNLENFTGAQGETDARALR
jgi:PAS domain-containing protein